MNSKIFTLHELELIIQQKQKKGRLELDKLYKLYIDNKFIGFEISKIKNGYQLKSVEIIYLIEKINLGINSSMLTVIYENQKKTTYTNYEISEERHSNGSLKVLLGEFFVYLPNLIVLE